MYWVGFRDVTIFATAIIASLATAAVGVYARGRALIAGAVIGNVVLLGLVAHIVSPFLMTPGLATILVMSAAAHPRFMPSHLAVLAGLSTLLVPFALEHLGVFASTIAITGSKIEVLTSASVLAPSATVIALVMLCFMLCTTAGVIAARQARARREAERRVFVQAWQLRQLVAG
jgi:serine/threonine-protein kinase